MPEIPMTEDIVKMVFSYAVPGMMIIITMYYSVKSLKEDMKEVKETIKMIASQQVELALIHERLEHHAHRLEQLEK